MYPRLKEAISNLKIIDDHGHPGGMEYFEDFPLERRISFFVDPYKSPEESSYGFDYQKELHYEAYEKLYGFSREDIMNPAKRGELAAVYEQKRRQLSSFIDEIMDLAGVETLLVNITMPNSLKDKKNFKFVPSLDPLIFPFDNRYLLTRVLGSIFINFYEYSLTLLKRRYGFTTCEEFTSYLGFVDQVMESYVNEGCPAFKLSLSYVRSTYFEKIDESEGPRLYEKAKNGDVNAYHKLQDLLVWHVMRRAVGYNIPVQIHHAVTDNHIRDFDPLNLANFLEDQELSKAKIVVLHGGYPRFDNAEALALGGLIPNNVYIDLSGRIMFANHPRIIAGMLRKWLEKPVLWDKILYGSDVVLGERYIYTAARTARDAVYYALEGMLNDEIINEDTAIAIAGKILRENALKLYALA